MPDKYDLHAQYAPAVLYSASFTVIGIYFLSQIKTSIWGHVLTLGVGGVTMTFALYQLARHAGRYLGVQVQEWTYQNGRNLPTTQFLLDEDTTYTNDRKAEIVAKIKSSFKTDLTNRTADTVDNRQRIHEVIGQVRKKFIKCEMVQRRNIQYGFWRNLVGGSLIAIIVSMLALMLSAITHNYTALELSVIFSLMYTFTSVFSFFAMKLCARYYASALFDELLNA